jgi:hypothetical protein
VMIARDATRATVFWHTGGTIGAIERVVSLRQGSGQATGSTSKGLR